jgi:hypothetical protein
MKHIISKQSYLRAVKGSLLGIFALLVLFHGSIAHANTPTLSLTPTGDGNSVQATIYGDPNVNVLLYYTKLGSGLQSTVIGNTNSSGYLSTVISSSAYNIAQGSVVYVSTSGPYGTSISASVAWPAGGTVANTLTFSQNNVSIAIGQTVPITIYGGSSIYTITSNSNPSSIQASISGSSVLLSTTGISGSSSITICSSYTTNMCGILYATAGGGGTSGSLTFSQLNPILAIGQTTTISIYGGTYNSYYISSNSNPNALSATVTNGSLILSGINTGSSTISVCSSGSVYGTQNNCGTLTATVGYNGGTGSLILSQTSLALSTGQTSVVTISGSGSYYISSNTNQSVATSAISGNTLSVYAGSIGTTSINICQYSSGQCAVLYVTVTGTNSGTVGNSYLTFSIPNPTLSVGQSTVIYITGGQGGGYTIPYNSSAAALATISGNTITLTGRQTGYAIIAVCDSYNNCGALFVGVGVGAITPPIIVNPSPVTVIFTSHLYLGLTSSQVLQLQQLLTTLGFYSGSVDGHFGLLTQQAVERYQSNHGLRPDGDVGPNTIAQLNTGR